MTPVCGSLAACDTCIVFLVLCVWHEQFCVSGMSSPGSGLFFAKASE